MAAAAAAALCAGLLAGQDAAGAAPTAITAGSGGWHPAVQVPGTAALNIGGNATVFAVSCTAPGTCAAGGSYGSDSTDQNATQAFLVSQRAGRWGTASKPRGLRALGVLSSEIRTVSCASAGNCAAGGDYTDFSGSDQAMIVTERAGRWGKAVEVPGTATLNADDAEVTSVSCAAAGDCLAGGFYDYGAGNFGAFLASQHGGRWARATRVPGLAPLDTGKDSRLSSVSCPSPGNCAAGGFYLDSRDRWQAFVATERSGQWSPAIEVPGTPALNIGGDASVDSVSCASAGNCAASGYYEASKYNGSTATWQAFAVSEQGGRWRRAVPLLGRASVNDNTVGAAAESVSCASAGNCAAGGAYLDRSGHLQAFVASERAGLWGTATEVPGTAALNTGGAAEVFSVFCPAAGDCTAGGYYTHHGSQAFVVSERGGAWRGAIEVPGTASLNAGRNAAVNAVSCPGPSACTAGGYYTDGSHRGQAFVVSRT